MCEWFDLVCRERLGFWQRVISQASRQSPVANGKGDLRNEIRSGEEETGEREGEGRKNKKGNFFRVAHQKELGQWDPSLFILYKNKMHP